MLNYKTSFVQRIKNLWAWSDRRPVDDSKITKKDVNSLWDKIEEDFKPKQRLAKIVQEPLPDNFEEDDTTN